MQHKFFSKKSLHIRYICGMCMCRAANQKQCPRVKHLVFMSEIVAIMSETCFRLLQASPELVFFLFSGSNSCLKLWLSDLSKSESLLDCITADIINNCPWAEIPDVHVFGLLNIVGMVIMDVIVTPLPTLEIAVCAWECPFCAWFSRAMRAMRESWQVCMCTNSFWSASFWHSSWGFCATPRCWSSSLVVCCKDWKPCRWMKFVSRGVWIRPLYLWL